jgi:predicted DNA-binding helix-hairpin-helix protein
MLLNPACIYICAYCILSEFHTTEASILLFEVVNSHLHLYGCGYHHNRIDGASLEAGADDVGDDSVTHYVEYYD